MDKPIDKLLYEIGMALLSTLTSKEGLAATRLVIAELHDHPELAKLYYKDGTQCMVDLLAQFLEQQHKRGKLIIKDPESASACFFALLKGKYYIRMLLDVPPAPSPQEKTQHVKETVQNYLTLYGKK